MKILMIVPATRVVLETKKNVPGLFSVAPNSFQLLAAMAPEHEYSIINETLGEKIDFNKVYDLIAITILTAQANRGYIIADEWRKRGIPVVIGGFHASILPDEALKHCDAVCIGEGELVWPQILKDLKEGNLKKTYRADKLIDLKNLPRIKKSIPANGMENVLQATRGCPFNCSFCSVNKFFGKQFRRRPVDDIVEEIKTLKENKKLKYNLLFLMDDNIAADPAYALELFAAIAPLKIRWLSQAAITIADNVQLLEAAKNSGCVWLLIGFESVSKESLNEAGKKHALSSNYKTAIKTIHSYKISIFGMFVLGFDNDDKDIFRQTYEFIDRNNLDYGVLNILTPFPGTRIYEELKAQDRIVDYNWDNYDMMHAVYIHNKMTCAEMEYLRNYYTRKINSLRSIVKRSFGAKTNFFINIFVNLNIRKLFKLLPKPKK